MSRWACICKSCTRGWQLSTCLCLGFSGPEISSPFPSVPPLAGAAPSWKLTSCPAAWDHWARVTLEELWACPFSPPPPPQPPPRPVAPQCPAQDRLLLCTVEDSTHQTPAPEPRWSCWGGEPALGTLSLKTPPRCGLPHQKQPLTKILAHWLLAREQNPPKVATKR